MTALGFLALLAPAQTGTDLRRGGGFLLRLALTATALSAAAVGVLGAALSARLSHPFFILLRNISLSHAIERIEALISAVWVLPDLALLAALLILARQLLPVRGRPLPPWALAAAAFGAAALLSPTAFGLAVWSETIIPITGAGIAASPCSVPYRSARFSIMHAQTAASTGSSPAYSQAGSPSAAARPHSPSIKAHTAQRSRAFI